MKVIPNLAGVRRAASAVLAFSLFSMALTPAYASDTEVYLRTIGGESSPILEMFLDSSAVMLKCMASDTDCSTNYDASRIAALRNSVQNVLFGNPKLPSDANGVVNYKALTSITKPAPGYVKLGYARNNPAANNGGWLRFPATKLDDPSPMFTGRISVPVTTGFDLLGNVVGWDDSTNVIGAANATTLALGKAVAPVRLRFRNVTVPKDATVISARIVFTNNTVAGNVPAPPAVDVAMGLDDNAPRLTDFTSPTVYASFGTANYWGNIPNGNNTSPTGAQSVVITQTGTGSRTGRLDVTALMNNFVKANYKSGWDWCGGNNIAIRINAPSGNGGANNNNWTVYSSDGDATLNQSQRPRLEVVYTLPSANLANTCSKPQLTTASSIKNGLDDIEWLEDSSQVRATEGTLEPGLIGGASLDKRNYVALRFANIGVPQGSRIVSAYLYVTGACNRSTCTAPDLSAAAANPPTVPLTLTAYDADNVSAFCTNALTCTVPSYSTLGNVSWNTVLQNTMPDYNHAVDVTSFVSQIVNRGGWVSGNALAFQLANNSGTSYPNAAIAPLEVSPAAAPYLMITYQIPSRLTDLTGKMTARQGLAGDIEAFLWAEGGTPIGDAYQETARYMMGMRPKYDTTATTSFGGNLTSATYLIPDGTTTYQNPSNVKYYRSPVPTTNTECSASAGIFMMSGGANANASNVNNNATDTLSNDGAQANFYGAVKPTSTNVNSTGNDKANYQALVAVATALAQGKNMLGQKIRTNVVLFRAPVPVTNPPTPPSAMVLDLKLAAEGVSSQNGGKFYEATDESQLTASLLETLKTVIDTNGTITAPGVAVNQFNRLSHLDQLYYAVFDPPNPVTSRWTGNVKRYRLKFIDTAVSSSAIIADVNGNNAVDGLTGFFLSTAQSFWSASIDGASVKAGGAASKLPAPGSRNLFTNLAAASDLTLVPIASADAAKARAAFNVTSDTQVANLRNWLLGWGVDIKDPNNVSLVNSSTVVPTTNMPQRNEMGGVLHSQPVLVNYGYLSGSNLNDTNTDPATSTNPNYNADYQDNTVFFSTMEGMLHAVDAKTGAEQFAFMPKHVMAAVPDLAIEKLLPNVSDLPAFGLDLTWTPWRVDADGNLKIEGNNANDRMWIFGGMRMGGRNYYALDVKDRTGPLLKWMIEGGTTSASTSSGAHGGAYQGLGQTWSQPVLANIKINGVVTPVLFVGGGYDTKHENTPYSNTADPTGGWFYIINAVTGDRLFSATGTTNAGTPTLSVSDLKWSVTGSPKVLDVDQDGLVDAVYFGDLAGQVFRADINNAGNTGASDATGYTDLVKRIARIANLGQFSNSPTTETVTDQRRFYESPSVALMKDSAGVSYVAVALGSGNRSHPLNTATTDRFYVLKDTDVLRKDLMTTNTLNVGTITPTDLGTVDPTSVAGATLTNKKGWQIGFLNTGEKVMSKAIILLGEVFFTTYTPDTSVNAGCTAAPGESRLYRMSAVDGAVSFDINKDGTVTASDRAVGGRKGLVGEPQPFVDASGKNAILTGTGIERNRDLQTPGLRRTRWFMMQKR